MTTIHNPIRKLSRAALVVALGFFVFRSTGCDYNITGNPDVSLLTVSLSPQAATLNPGGQLRLVGSAKNYRYDSSLTWELANGAVGSLTSVGSMATYTAPATIIASPTTVTLIARSHEDTSRFAQCIISIITADTNTHGGNKVNLALTPLSITLQVGGTTQFQATVTGSTNMGTAWKIVSGQGTLSATGYFTAPQSITTSTITTIIQATALADTSVWAQATITTVAPADTGVCFTRDVLPILVSNCGMSGCHGTGSGRGDFTTYSGTKHYVTAGNARNSRLYEAIIKSNGDDRMPPAPRSALTQSQISLIGRWIDEGAKNTDCSDTTTPGNGCDTTAVHYSAFVKGVIQNYCLGCHAGSSASKGIDLSTYSGVQQYANNGQLMGGIMFSNGYIGMPQGGSKLDDCTIAKIQAWVNRGAPND